MRSGARYPSKMSAAQPSLFDDPPPPVPGLRYRAQLLTAGEEAALIRRLRELPFAPFEFQQWLGKRRVVSFGWRYDFGDGRLAAADALPDFLHPLRERAAALAGLAPQRLAQALVTEYAPGAGIGWHRDRPVFEKIVGVSLLSETVMRFRRRIGERFERINTPVAPRSAYMLDGPARLHWEHSLPEAKAHRYSITFRNLRTP